jgi:hypothetical protein
MSPECKPDAGWRGRVKIPNPKHQIPNKDQIRRTEIQNARGPADMLWVRAALLSPSASSTTIVAGPFWSFEFAILNLFVICDLVLGISHQRAHHLSWPHSSVDPLRNLRPRFRAIIYFPRAARARRRTTADRKP